MKIRFSTWNGPKCTLEQRNRRRICVWWVGTWRDRGPFRKFFSYEKKHYHQGWTEARFVYCGPVRVDVYKSLTFDEKHDESDK